VSRADQFLAASTGDFSEALAALLGKDAAGLSASAQMSSGLPLKADIARRRRHFAFVPGTEQPRCAIATECREGPLHAQCPCLSQYNGLLVFWLLIEKVAEEFNDVLAGRRCSLSIIGYRDATFPTGVFGSGGLTRIAVDHCALWLFLEAAFAIG
jgi:hypothetical protein